MTTEKRPITFVGCASHRDRECPVSANTCSFDVKFEAAGAEMGPLRLSYPGTSSYIPLIIKLTDIDKQI
ncbi:hypothetical protein T07_12463 [Trichinella nelsoni]|uniref:Uncharacterized protein n=1 Tax=Trichinella nelsoni TaxID=6336 RepID=A0A0V0RWA8_9BILA|nr:hypothetical protein T07_12463 [Trichinella nelsoni]